MISEAQPEIYKLFQVINNGDYKRLVERIGIPRCMLTINKLNLDWNIIYEKFDKDSFAIAENTFRFIPESGLLTSNDLFISSREVNERLTQFMGSIKDKVPHNELYLDFSLRHSSGYFTYPDNIVALYNPSAGMVLQDEEKNKYYFRRVDPFIDGESLTEKGLYKLGRSAPRSSIPDGAYD